MNAVCDQGGNPISGTNPKGEESKCGALSSEEASLLAEVRRLGGEEGMKQVEAALEKFQAALDELVRKDPKAYGAGDDPEEQRRTAFELARPVRASFLNRTVESLRRAGGYVPVFGRWIHRAVFTFLAFGLLASIALPFCIVSLASTAPWGWVPGVGGVLAALAGGLWILGRVRHA